jgi:hypothetical protein
MIQRRRPTLGVWVAFLKQPALPGEAPKTKQSLIKKITNESKVVQRAMRTSPL